MKNIRILNFALLLLFTLASLKCSSTHTEENHSNLVPAPDEIVFYSNGSEFSPVIVLQSDAIVTWTWADSTSSQSTTPTKAYGSALLRENRLKVTPWSAILRINIGYDANDDGSDTIELVADQNVSSVENLHLVAPFLKQWCSAYNEFDSLDFSNFVNIETIECVGSKLLTHVNLANTPKLRRACFEDSHLLNLDLSESPALEDLRGASNNYNTLTFSDYYENVWHICVRDNPDLSTQNVFNNAGIFPHIAELFIWHTNQQGALVVPGTHAQREVSVMGSYNQYSSIDFTGAFQNPDANGIVEMSHNDLTRVDIEGCIQIKKLDLVHNNLDSHAIDQILKQVDDYGTHNGTIDLRFNKPPTHLGAGYIVNLERRGWVVSVDQMVPVESISISDGLASDTILGIGTEISLNALVEPENASDKTIEWTVENVTGQADIDDNGLLIAAAPGLVKVTAKAVDGSKVISQKEYNIVFPSAADPLDDPFLVRIYPNPSTGSIQVHLDEMPSESVVVQIWNLLGQKLLEQNIFTTVTGLSFKKVSPGIYIVVLKGKNWVSNKKVVF